MDDNIFAPRFKIVIAYSKEKALRIGGNDFIVLST